MELEEISNAAVAVAVKAGHFIADSHKEFSLAEVVNKGQRDLVSYVDLQSEKMIVEGLKGLLPEAGFLTEEKTIAESNPTLRWIIDPLDGTTNFIHGVAPYAVSIALQMDGEVVVGIVYEIGADECFHAIRNGGAFCNGKKISVARKRTMDAALFATGFPYKAFEQEAQFFGTLQYLFNHTHGVRRFGSAAVDLAYVACGRFDGFFEYHLNAWDVAAGALIVQEAGGMVSDFSGGKNYLFGKEIVASNRSLHVPFLSTINNGGGILVQEQPKQP